MKSVLKLWLSVFYISLLIEGAASASPIAVSLKELIVKPSQFNGRVVSVTGYLDTTQAHTCDLRVEKTRPDDMRALVNLQLPKASYAKINSLTHGHRQLVLIRVTGVFEYKDLSVPEKTATPNQSGGRAITRVPTGFGWMGLNDKQITRVSKIEPASSE